MGITVVVGEFLYQTSVSATKSIFAGRGIHIICHVDRAGIFASVSFGNADRRFVLPTTEFEVCAAMVNCIRAVGPKFIEILSGRYFFELCCSVASLRTRLFCNSGFGFSIDNSNMHCRALRFRALFEADGVLVAISLICVEFQRKFYHRSGVAGVATPKLL